MRLLFRRCRWGCILFAALLGPTTVVSGEESERINIFFGFDMILSPVAIKWTCGGEKTADILRLQALIDAFPEDAASAQLPEIIEQLAASEITLSDHVPSEVAQKYREEICEAATPLDLSWLEPELLLHQTEDVRSEDHKEAWYNFYEVIENIQREAGSN